MVRAKRQLKVISRDEAKALGLTRYYTGERCRQGHRVERYTSMGRCCECERIKVYAWKDANWESYSKANSDRYFANVDVERERRRISYAANPEKHKARMQVWRTANPELVKKGSLRWRQANPDRKRQIDKEWGLANPGKVVGRNRARRARKAGAEGSHTEYDLFCIFVIQDAQCAGCGKSLLISCTVDHVVPLKRGGSNWPDNIQLLCSTCNSSKGTKTQAEWLAFRELFLID